MVAVTNTLNRGDLREWLVEMFKARETPPRSISVKHVTDGGDRGQECQSFPVTKEYTVDHYVRAIARVVERDAKGFGGLNRFAVLVYHTDSVEGNGTGRYPITILADPVEDANGEFTVSEPPNAKGFLAQSMRHMEQRHQQAHSVETHASSVLERQIDKLQARVDHLEKERTEMVEKFETALSLQHDREMRQKEFEAKELRMKQVMDLVMMLGPTIVNRMAGKQLLPEKTDPRVEMLRSVLASLDEKQFDMLQKIFRKEQFIVIADMYTQFMEEEQRELAKQRKEAGLDKSPPQQAAAP